MGMPTFVGAGTASSGSGALALAWPGGYTALTSDIAMILNENDAADTPMTPTGGWTQAASVTQAGGTTTELTCWWRRMTTGDSVAAVDIADTGNHNAAQLFVVRGCKTAGNPWNTIITNIESVSDTSVSVTGGVTTVADCFCICAVGTGQDIATTGTAVTGWANASLGSVTARGGIWTAAGTGGGFSFASGTKAVAGATGATTATLGSPLVANFKTLMMIALEGAATVASRPLRARRLVTTRHRTSTGMFGR